MPDSSLTLVRFLYEPLLPLLPALPHAHILLFLGGGGLFAAALNIHGPLRWVVVLFGLYLLGGGWAVPLLRPAL